MTRKDNNFVTLWNEGFRKMQSSGAFAKMCKEAENKYGNLLLIRVYFIMASADNKCNPSIIFILNHSTGAGHHRFDQIGAFFR